LSRSCQVLPRQRVGGYRRLVGLQLRLGGELAVLEEVGHLEEAASIGELLDRIATVTEDPFLAVDVADGGAGLGGVGEPAVERDQPGLGPQPSDVYGDLTFTADLCRESDLLVFEPEDGFEIGRAHV